MNPMALVVEMIVLITGIFCLYISIQLGKRRLTESGDQLAWSAFRIWWLALGVNILLSAIQTVAFEVGVNDLSAYLSIMLISTLVLCVALWGLLFYLIYLFTGKRFLAWPLAAFYGLVYLSLVVYIFLVLHPIGVETRDGAPTLRYATNAPQLNLLIIALFILLPQILAAIAYLTLYFRVKDRDQRYRVLLVSLSILIWFSSPLIALGLGWSALPWWSLASRLLGMAAVTTIYWAYYPPLFIQHRLGVASI